MDRDCPTLEPSLDVVHRRTGIPLVKSHKSTKTDRLCVYSCDFTSQTGWREEESQ